MMSGMDDRTPARDPVAALRALMPPTGAGIHMDAATAGPSLAETAAALAEADAHELRVGRGGPDHPADAAFRREEAGGVVAAILGALPDAVVVTDGLRAATLGTLAVLRSPGAPLLLHPGLERGLAAAIRATDPAAGVVPPAGPLPAGALVLAPAVRDDTGERTDVAMLTAAVRAAGGRLVLDATLLAGALPFSAPETGADAIVLATDRWLLGPDGSAAAWLRDTGEAARLRAIADPMPRRTALGLGRSVGWLLMYAGLPWVHERTAAVVARLHAALAAIPGVTVAAPLAESATLLVIRIAGWEADDAADELGRRVFAILARDPEAGILRLSPGAWTTDAEVDRLAAAVAELAAHTPETLPRRPALVVFSGADGDGERG